MRAVFRTGLLTSLVVLLVPGCSGVLVAEELLDGGAVQPEPPYPDGGDRPDAGASPDGGTPDAGLPAPVQADLFVSPEGNDSWSGQLAEASADGTDGPLRTFAEAQRRVTEIQSKAGARTEPITVRFRGGTYPLEAPIAFTAAHSGTASLRILYAAYPGETPLFSGGASLSGWTRSGDHWTTTDPGDVAFEQLFVDGVRHYRPTFGNPGGYLYVANQVFSPSSVSGRCTTYEPGYGYLCDDRFVYASGDALDPGWHNLSDVQIVDFEKWTVSRLRIERIDPNAHIVYLTGSTYPSADHGFFPGHRYLVENVREALSQPGQWYRDSVTREVDYVAAPGEDPNQETITVPRLTQLLTATGLRHVTFQGLTFSYAHWGVPAAGHPSGQGEQNVGAAVSLNDSSDLVLDGCTVSHVGPWGIEVIGTAGYSGSGYDHQILSSTLYDVGAGGIRIGNATADETGGAQHVLVSHTLVQGVGRMLPQGSGIWIGLSHHDTIEYSEVSDAYNVALSAGQTWGRVSSAAHDNLLQFNLLHDVGQGITSDLAGVYLATDLGANNQVLNNVIHDVVHDPSPGVAYQGQAHFQPGYGGWGLYFDQGTSGVVARNNLVYRTSASSFHQNWDGADNVLGNNLFAYALQGMLDRSSHQEDFRSFTLENNILDVDHSLFWGNFECTGGTASASSCAARFLFHSNLYWKHGSALGLYVTTSSGGQTLYPTLSAWQGATGEDTGSLTQDPAFVDAAAGDFRFASGSPVGQVGFVPFDSTQAGRGAGSALLPPVPPAFPLQLPASF